MFWKPKDPGRNWVISQMKQGFQIKNEAAEELRNLVKEWDGYNEILTESFCVYPVNKSIPILTYALADLVPTGFLEVGRAPGRLALHYGQEGARVILGMAKSGPDQSFVRALLSLYYQEAVNETLGYFYWMVLSGLVITKEFISHQEIQEAAYSIKKSKPIWGRLIIAKEFEHKLSFLL